MKRGKQRNTRKNLWLYFVSSGKECLEFSVSLIFYIKDLLRFSNFLILSIRDLLGIFFIFFNFDCDLFLGVFSQDSVHTFQKFITNFLY